MIDMNQEDDLLKRLFEEAEVQPKTNITEKVMHRIDVNPKAFEYEPVISKKAWIIMGSIFSLVMIFLLLNAAGSKFEIPVLILLLKDSFANLGGSFSFEFTRPKLPEIPSTILMAIAALNVIGVYLIFSFRWRKWMFRQ